MSISTNSEAASHHQGEIANKGNLATVLIPGVASSASPAATRAQTSSTRLSGLLNRYQTVAANSASSITVLSNNMISFDQQVSHQFTS